MKEFNLKRSSLSKMILQLFNNKALLLNVMVVLICKIMLSRKVFNCLFKLLAHILDVS